MFTMFFLSLQANDSFVWRDWQEGLKALLPNVNISFGNPNHNSYAGSGRNLTQSNGFLPSQNTSSSLHNSTQVPRDKSNAEFFFLLWHSHLPFCLEDKCACCYAMLVAWEVIC